MSKKDGYIFKFRSHQQAKRVMEMVSKLMWERPNDVSQSLVKNHLMVTWSKNDKVPKV